jgi:hypothetical protein
MSTNAGVRPEKLRIPRGHSERIEKPVSEWPVLAQVASLEELLASCVVRQMMKRDKLILDVRKLSPRCGRGRGIAINQAPRDSLHARSTSAEFPSVTNQRSAGALFRLAAGPARAPSHSFVIRMGAGRCRPLPRLVQNRVRSRDEAMRFALWQADGEPARVHVEPARVTRRGD